MTPAARAHRSWAVTRDRAARTAPARAGLHARFEREAREELGPQATEQQIADSAESRRRQFYIELSAAGRAARSR